jgi:hypothetical protein
MFQGPDGLIIGWLSSLRLISLISVGLGKSVLVRVYILAQLAILDHR